MCAFTRAGIVWLALLGGTALAAPPTAAPASPPPRIVVAFANEPHHRVVISSAPLVEGAVIAAVEASIGNSLQEVAEAAASAYTLPKVHDRNG